MMDYGNLAELMITQANSPGCGLIEQDKALVRRLSYPTRDGNANATSQNS